MERVTEPELMDDLAQARAYAEADFSEPNRLFVELYAEAFPDFGGDAILDLGCGPGDITLRLAARYPGSEVHGVDGSAAMLGFAAAARERAGEPGGRVRFIEGRIPGVELPRDAYHAVVSNSLLHHLHDPAGLWQTLRECAAPGACVLVMDLARPVNEARAAELVETHAGGEPEVLKRDFHNSLLAAFEPDEIRVQLVRAGILGLTVERVSDRHLAVRGRLA